MHNYAMLHNDNNNMVFSSVHWDTVGDTVTVIIRYYYVHAFRNVLYRNSLANKIIFFGLLKLKCKYKKKDFCHLNLHVLSA